jgi:hypothetical protein
MKRPSIWWTLVLRWVEVREKYPPQASARRASISKAIRDQIKCDCAEGQKGRKRRPAIEIERFRNEVLHELGACLPEEQWQGRRNRKDVQWLAQQFEPDDLATLVHWLSLLEAFGDSFIAAHFAWREPRRGWPWLGQIVAGLTLRTLQGADRLAGRAPRKSFGRPAAPLMTFVHDRLTCIVPEEQMPEPDNLLRRLERTIPKNKRAGIPKNFLRWFAQIKPKKTGPRRKRQRKSR